MATLPPEVTKLFNEVFRPAGENLTSLLAQYQLLQTNGQLDMLTALLDSLDDAEVLDDGRAAEGIQQLTVAEAEAGLALIEALVTGLNDNPLGVVALSKLRVRPLISA